ncbi:MAG TPA: SWIM zinc finger family protein [Candidatus Woesearchaeota archaeon]|nr:SWIM zinc finger family protein [Candidatus Woesearchaeota archaeon]
MASLRYFSEEKLKRSNVARGSILSAERVWKNVKVDYVTGQHIAFTCSDPLFDTSRSVLYFGERPFRNAWSCDCTWFSMKHKFCKHIIGVFYRLNRDPNFLSSLEKTVFT